MAMAAEEASLKALWDEASEDFRKRTQGKSLRKPVSLDDALSNLNAKLNPGDSKTGDVQAKVKSAATSIAKLIHLLGGLAAQGASMVFGSANMCFNALVFLVDIPAKLSKVWDDLAKLLDDVSTFMTQFKIYRDIEKITALDVEFRRSVHKLLIAFVDICGIAFKVCDERAASIARRWAKTVLFDDDDGVVAALKKFKDLSSQHDKIEGAVTLKHVIQGQNETAGSLRLICNHLNESAEANGHAFRELQETSDKILGNTDFVVKDVSERKDKDAKLDTIRKLRLKLGLPETIEKSENPLIQLRSRMVDGTGTWLNDMPVYREWIDIKRSERKLLVLKGKSSSGRSHLLTKIYDDLERLQDKSIRLCAVGYTFDIDEKVSGNQANQSAPVIQALKQIALQLASTDDVFSKLLSTHLDKLKNPEQIKDPTAENKRPRESKEQVIERNLEIPSLLANLFSQNTMRNQSRNYYVLLLDGFDQLPYQTATQLFDSLLRVETDQLKVALTATPDTISRLSTQDRGEVDTAFATIDIESNNHDDIMRFVKHQTADHPFASDIPAIRTIVQDLEDKVPDLALGSYKNANLIIESVREAIIADRKVEIILALISEKTLENPDSICQKTIHELEQSLSSQEIQQLNELLCWTITGRQYFNVDELRAILFLLMKQPMLTSLREKINTKFARMLKISEDGTVVMRDDEMESYLGKLPRLKQLTTGELGTDEPRISMQITITNAKISQVQRFIWDLSEKIVLNKMDQFTFTNLNLDMEKNVQDCIVSANPMDGQLAILRGCFDLLLGEPNDETRILTPYATENVLRHLPDLNDKDEKSFLTDEEKQYLVEQLVTLLENPDYIEGHLTKDFFEYAHLLRSFDLDKIECLLRDGVATSKLRYRQRRWVKSTLAEGMKTALKGIAKMIAHLWLSDTAWEALHPFSWLEIYMRMSTGYISESESGSESGNESGSESHSDDGSDSESKSAQRVFGDTSIGSVEPHGDGTSINGDIDEASMVEGANLVAFQTQAETAFLHKDEHSVDISQTKPETEDNVESEQSHANDHGETPSHQSSVPAVNKQSDEDEARNSPRSRDRILRVLKWVEEELGLTHKSPLWYERIGFTYLDVMSDGYVDDLVSTAGKEAFLTAKSLTDQPSWRISEGLSRCYARPEQLHEAIDEVRVAIKLLKSITKRSEEEESRLLKCRLNLSDWLIDLEQVQLGVQVLEEIVMEQPKDMKPYWSLFETLCKHELESRALDFMQQMAYRRRDNSKLTELGQFLLSICSDNLYEDRIKQILHVVKDSDIFDLVLQNLSAAYCSSPEKERSNEAGLDIQIVTWFYALALARYSRSKEGAESALPYLKQIMELGFGEDRRYLQNDLAVSATKCYFECLFSRVLELNDMLPESSTHRSDIINLLKKHSDDSWYGADIRLMLATYYHHHGKEEDARRLIRTEIQSAFGLLDDRIPDNDDQGYVQLGFHLLRAGDELNGLAAISLSGPTERYDISDDFVKKLWSCEGDCEATKTFTWSDTFWLCRICDNTNFCVSCTEKLRSGNLKRVVCSKNHDWVSVGGWTQEFEHTGEGNVRVGGILPPRDGQCQDGNRIGGQIVAISDWLDAIRKQWDIVKPPPWPYAKIDVEKDTIFPMGQDGCFLIADFLHSENDDLVLMKSNKGENYKIQVAYATNDYQQIDYEHKTSFRGGEKGTWSLFPSNNGNRPDLYLIKNAKTSSGKVEIHMATASSNYQQRTAKVTAFKCENNGIWNICDFHGRGQPDLTYIKTSDVGDGGVRVYCVSAESNYKDIHESPRTWYDDDDKATYILSPWSHDQDEMQTDLFAIFDQMRGIGSKVHLNVSVAPDYGYAVFREEVVFDCKQEGVWAMSTKKKDKPDLIFIKTGAGGEGGRAKILISKG